MRNFRKGKRLPAAALVLLLGAVMSLIFLHHVSSSLNDHRAHQGVMAELQCPEGTRITIIEGDRKICLTHHIRTYAASSLLVTKTVAK